MYFEWKILRNQTALEIRFTRKNNIKILLKGIVWCEDIYVSVTKKFKESE
jgi:hypothetical protein